MKNSELTNPLKGVDPGTEVKIVKRGGFTWATRRDGFGTMTDLDVAAYKELRPHRYGVAKITELLLEYGPLIIDIAKRVVEIESSITARKDPKETPEDSQVIE